MKQRILPVDAGSGSDAAAALAMPALAPSTPGIGAVFTSFARWAERQTGRSYTFALAVVIIVVRALSNTGVAPKGSA
jgi:hypothetical protein